MTEGFIKPYNICVSCGNTCELKKYTRNIDGFAWRCVYTRCANCKNYYGIRRESFFRKI